MTTNPTAQQPNPARARAASLRRKAAGLSLGFLLASFGAVAMTGTPASPSDPLASLIEEPAADVPAATPATVQQVAPVQTPAARPSAPAQPAAPQRAATAAPAPATPTVRPAPQPQPAPRAQQPRRSRTRQS